MPHFTSVMILAAMETYSGFSMDMYLLKRGVPARRTVRTFFYWKRRNSYGQNDPSETSRSHFEAVYSRQATISNQPSLRRLEDPSSDHSVPSF